MMKQIPTSEEYMAMFEELVPIGAADWTLEEKLLGLLHYIGAATGNLAAYVSLYQERTGIDIVGIVIKQFLTDLEHLSEDEVAE